MSTTATASEKKSVPKLKAPAGSCDTHMHFYDKRFPLAKTAASAPPEDGSVATYRAMQRRIGFSRTVVVQPTAYGLDNSCTLAGMAELGKANARGVAVIDDKTPESDLDAMQKDGFRGIRLNLATGGVNDPNVGKPRFQAAVDRVKARGLHVQLFTSLAMISAIKDLVSTSPVPVVFDHFGGAQAELGLDQPGFADLVELVRSGKAYVKISGAYRASKLAPDYPDAAPLARALIAANPDRVVWGTDWPHPDSVTPPGRKATEVTPLFQIDDGRLLNQLAVWSPDEATRRKILVDNPALLYGF